MPSQTCIPRRPQPATGTQASPLNASSNFSAPDPKPQKPESPLYVKTVVFRNGERFPMLLRRSDGFPLLAPTVYITSMPRMTGNQPATLESRLRSIMFLYLWGMRVDIDIEERFRQKAFLTVSEVERLVSDAAMPVEDLIQEHAPPKKTRSKVAAISSLQTRPEEKKAIVKSKTKGKRLYYIGGYLDWLAEKAISCTPLNSHEHARLTTSRHEMLRAIEARTPSEGDGSLWCGKMGLTEKEITLLREVLNPESPDNPWRDPRVKVRNQALIMLLLATGMRKGEALGLRMEDLDMAGRELTIHRTPDDPLDPRVNKPQTKTLARALRLEREMFDLLRDYVTRHRHKGLPQARKGPFLFTQTDTGGPLTLRGVSKMFEVLREKVPKLPRNFSPHILRHTWNDKFSKHADEMIRSGKWNIADEQKYRTYLMGWVPHSEMAIRYSRRHIIEEAKKVGRSLQDSIFSVGGSHDQ